MIIDYSQRLDNFLINISEWLKSFTNKQDIAAAAAAPAYGLRPELDGSYCY